MDDGKMTNLDYIREKVPREDLLLQLAEECSELAQAALKLRRTMVPGNPTPVTQDKALANLREEIVDVLTVLYVLDLSDVENSLWSIQKKLARWAGRIMAQEQGREIE